MASYPPNFFKAYLATALTAGVTSATVVLDRITTLTGETIETADLSTLGKGVITINPDGDGNTSYPESVSFTGVTAATKTLTGCKRGLDKAAAENTDYMRYHPVGTPVIVSFGVHQVADLITYLNTLVVSTRSVIMQGVGGETGASGKLVYLKSADGRWWLCSASTAATVENVQLGILQGAMTAGGQISPGVLLIGRDTTNSGLTAGSTYYATNASGGIATSPGTKEVTVGSGTADGYLYFNPRFNQQLTENQQDLIDAFEGGTDFYAATSVGTDAYAITLSHTLSAYANGQRFRFKTDVANTGAATLAVNGLAAITIKKRNNVDLATGDLNANQMVEVIYNSTGPVFEMTSQTDSIPSALDYQVFTASGTWTKPAGLSGTELVTIEAWGGGGGGGGISSSTGTAGGGGGGAYITKKFRASDLGSTETVTIGAGGTQAVAGGNTTFGSVLTAYGGGLGDNISGGSSAGGGGGGGAITKGNDASGATGGTGGGPGASAHSVSVDGFGGGGGGSSGETGGDSGSGGGGGGGGSQGGGASVFGGGGGGGGAGIAGPSKFGGAGGAGGTNTNGSNGTAPGGGGGGGQRTGSGTATGGTGGRGEVRVWVIK